MTTPEATTGTAVFKPRTSKWFTFIAFVLVGIGLSSLVATEGPAGLLGASPLLAVAYGSWWLFWYPTVVVDGAAVTLRNPLATISIPWSALVHVDTKYALKLLTPRAAYSAWAAPAPGVWGTHAGKVEHLTNLPASSYGPGSSVRPGDLKHTDSGYAAFLVRSRWETMIENGELDVDQTSSARVIRRVNWILILPALALLVASLASRSVA